MIKAILTGHSKGLGLGVAYALLSKGHPVLGLSRSLNTTLQQQFPDLLHQVPIDLSENIELDQWIQGGAMQQFIEKATLVLLINNAGLVTPIGPLTTQKPANIANSVQLNVTTPMVLSAWLAQAMKVRQQLRILHVSSGAGRSAYPGWSVYCATKAALDMHAMASQLDPLAQVKICSLAPGVIDTEMQGQIRQIDPALFPNKQRFEQLKQEGLLSDPMHTGERLVDYLLGPKFGDLAIDDLRQN